MFNISGISQGFKKKVEDVFYSIPGIEDNLTIYIHIPEKKLNQRGDFPRRVQIGEIIIEGDGVRIPSPIQGIARHNREIQAIQITADGAINLKTSKSFPKFSFQDIVHKIKDYCLTSLDFFPNYNLSDLFTQFRPETNSQIVLSPFSIENHINYKDMILSKMQEEWTEFKSTLQNLFPNSELRDFFYIDRRKYQYPDCDPRFFLYKYNQSEIFQEFPSKRILFLGAETIYHLLRGLYHQIPFHERFLRLYFINKTGSMIDSERIFLLKNGQRLGQFLQSYMDSYKYFTLNTFYKPTEVFEMNTEFVYNIYNHSAIILSSNYTGELEQRFCNDCYACSDYCPVQANPRALLNENTVKFQKNLCIDCGICTVFCPSHIDLRTQISNTKRINGFV